MIDFSNKSKIIFKICAAYAIMVLTFFILILCVYLIPPSLLKENICKSELLIINESENGNDIIWGIKFLKKDNFTDGTMYNILASTGKNNSLNNSILNPRATDVNGLLTPAEAGYKIVADNQSNIIYWNYGRYWHGYLVPLSLMTILMPLSYLRMLNHILLCLLFIITAYLMARKINWKFSFCFIVASLLICLPSVPYSLQYSTCFYITYISTIIILTCKKISKSNINIYVYFFIVGGVTSFLDFLTTPVICLGIPLLTYNALHPHLKPRNIIHMILLWLIGYGGIWATKWILATCITSENIIMDAMTSAQIRSSLNFSDENHTYIKTIILTCTIAIVGFILIYTYTKNIRKEKNGNLLSILIIGFLPIIWYLLFWNHSSVHLWFTWRSLYVSDFSALLLLLNTHYNTSKSIQNERLQHPI